jgi:hypothetical protein
MLFQFLVSIAVSVCNIAIHAVVMDAVLRVARAVSERATSRQSLRLIAGHDCDRVGFDDRAYC